NIQFQIDAQNLAFAIADAIPIGLIVSELVTNAIKHAFIKKQDGMIQISMQKSDELIKLVVSDNGSGIKEGVDMSGAKSLGLYIVDNLVKIQLRGEIEVSSGEGTKYTIKFPVPDSSHVISVVNR
ncbi:MAG: sensor histidine kinase, partial [Candidatus Sabulitectum sp.]|nr:sensor histidine kinase [Candidatus Sabulitectum sp.]